MKAIQSFSIEYRNSILMNAVFHIQIPIYRLNRRIRNKSHIQNLLLISIENWSFHLSLTNWSYWLRYPNIEKLFQLNVLWLSFYSPAYIYTLRHDIIILWDKWSALMFEFYIKFSSMTLHFPFSVFFTRMKMVNNCNWFYKILRILCTLVYW